MRRRTFIQSGAIAAAARLESRGDWASVPRGGYPRSEGVLCAPTLAAPEFGRLAMARAPRAMRLVNG